MRALFAALFCLALAVPAHAQSMSNATAADLSARACINHLIGQDAQNGFMQSAGYKLRGRTFTRKGSTMGLSGHSDRTWIRFERDGCSYSYSDNRGAQQAMQAFENAFRAQGLREVSVQSRRGKTVAFHVGTKLFKITGYTSHENSSYYTHISASSR